MIDPTEIARIFELRRRNRGGYIQKMVEVQRMYDGDIWVPLPELDENERPGVANLLLQGVEQLGMRASSVLPDTTFLPLRPGVDKWEAMARDQRRAYQGWEDMNGLTKKEGRRCRFLVAYGSGPTMIKPAGGSLSIKRSMPHWHIINPLCIFPSETSDPDDIEPSDVIIQRHVTLGWLRDRYPVQAANLYKGPADRNGQHANDKKFDLLEWNDAEETVLIACGSREAQERWTYADANDGHSRVELLERSPNRAGVCLATVPGRISLSRLTGHFDQIIGMFMAQAKLTAYEMIAVRDGIFPQKWAVSHPNNPTGTARIIQLADAKQGIIGEIEGGTIIPMNPQSGPAATNAIDRLERGQRVQAGIPSDWGGESATNIRTAKRGEQVSSSTVDPTLGEIQNILAEAKTAEAAKAIAVMKGWYGNKMVSFYQPRSGKVVGDAYKANELFVTDFAMVKYSMPGVDASGIPIELGQRTQSGLMSQYTARREDPMIEDPDFEELQVPLEGLRMAALKGLEQGLAAGQLDIHEVAMIASLLNNGKGLQLEEAIAQAHDMLQKQQAVLAAQNAPPGGAPGAESMPGLAPAPPPGAAAPAGGPPPLAQVLAGLRQPTQQSPAEQQLGQPTPPPPGG